MDIPIAGTSGRFCEIDSELRSASNDHIFCGTYTYVIFQTGCCQLAPGGSFPGVLDFGLTWERNGGEAGGSKIGS